MLSLGKISALQKAAKEYIFGPSQCKYSNTKRILKNKNKKVASMIWRCSDTNSATSACQKI